MTQNLNNTLTNFFRELSWETVWAEIKQPLFWKSLFCSLLWTAAGAGMIFVLSHVLRWKTQVHELVWLIVLPLPATFAIAIIAGWWHRSLRVTWMIRAIGTGLYLLVLPYICLAIILASGFASIK